MESFSALLALCAGNSPVPGEFPAQKTVTRSFDVFFDLRPNKRLSKQWRGWWFETPSSLLWRHCYVGVINYPYPKPHVNNRSPGCFCFSVGKISLFTPTPVFMVYYYPRSLYAVIIIPLCRFVPRSALGHASYRRNNDCNVSALWTISLGNRGVLTHWGRDRMYFY